jgi:HEAT repeat protein
VEICLVEALMAVHGYGRDRMRALAVDLGLADSWKRRLSSRNAQRRKECVEYLGLLGQSDLRPIFERSLSDPDPLVCAAACRSLLGLGGTIDSARLFRLAIEGPLLLRAMVAGDLRRHSLALSSSGLPELAAATEPHILAGLGVISAWERLLHVPEVASLTLHMSVEVRAAAIRSLGFVQASVDTESLILAALEDPVPEIRLAAVFACSQRGLRSSIDSLARQLRGDDPACTQAACDALANLGDDGRNILEACVLDPNLALAGKALEALAAAHLKPASSLQLQ